MVSVAKESFWSFVLSVSFLIKTLISDRNSLKKQFQHFSAAFLEVAGEL
jgi:hypothetical protein